MSVHALSWALHSTIPQNREDPQRGEIASKIDLLVLIALCDCANIDGTGAWPSIGTIAETTRMHERGVRKALRSLEAGGFIVGKQRTGSTTVYSITWLTREEPSAGGHTVPGAPGTGGAAQECQKGGTLYRLTVRTVREPVGARKRATPPSTSSTTRG